MLQRVMIAIALMLKPKVLIADEPTTSLDRTVQNEIIKLLDHIRYDHDAGIIFVSHDLHVITGIADDITVMYSGYSVEQAPKDVIVHAPRHPYTRGLFRSRPNYSRERLVEIPGQPPTLKERNCQEGCLFLGRCPYRTEACEQYDMGPVKLDDRHTVRCCRCGEIE
jgi:oligopeptide/dipeptide ABC transporter ATP-binding protein